jgi:hypothetical protein
MTMTGMVMLRFWTGKGIAGIPTDTMAGERVSELVRKSECRQRRCVDL